MDASQIGKLEIRVLLDCRKPYTKSTFETTNKGT